MKLSTQFVAFFIALYTFTLSDISGQEQMPTENQMGARLAVLDFFEGFHKSDTLIMRKVLLGDVPMQTIANTPEGVKTNISDVNSFLVAIHNRKKDQKWSEKLLDIKVRADDMIAEVWTPYEFYLNDEFSHCGVNVFQLFNTVDGWKIISIADSRKKKGCVALN